MFWKILVYFLILDLIKNKFLVYKIVMHFYFLNNLKHKQNKFLVDVKINIQFLSKLNQIKSNQKIKKT